MTWPSMWELLIIAVIVLLLFGGNKLKEIMKAFGEGIREFRKASSAVSDDVQAAVNDTSNEDQAADETAELSDQEKSQGPAG
ncbi:MAG: twin-arginine translocase TatA/TatE family subunit [Armatimonadota bacterium]